MNYSTPRMISLLLIFGIFFAISCTALQQSTESAEVLFEKGNYSQALSAIDKQIREYPDEPEHRLFKAKILNKIAAGKVNPSDRHNDYRTLKNTVDEVRFQTDRYNASIDSLLVYSWTHEQQEGVKLLQQGDPEKFDEKSDFITAHFLNAIILIPDSTVTYSLKATTHYKNGETSRAIQTLEDAQVYGANFTPKMMEKLSYLYLEAGDFESSVDLYRELTDKNPENEKYKHGLVNALILQENHEESVSLLRELVENNPERSEYREALATELYYSVLLKISALQAGIDTLTEEEIESEVNKIVTEFKNISSVYNELNISATRSEDSLYRAASFYTNSAVNMKYLQESTASAGNSLENLYREHLELSIPYWESLIEYFPEAIQYAEQLYRVYTLLDMDDEAELLYQQLNF